jgi:hypothetical protein
MADLVMMGSHRVAEALERICSVSWIIADWNNHWREENNDICRFEISYDGKPVERVMDKSDRLLKI